MRPAGMLVLEEIAIWLGPPYWPNTTRCKSTYRLLLREGIAPAVRGHQRKPSLWRFVDLEPLKDLVPSARYDDEWEAA